MEFFDSRFGKLRVVEKDGKKWFIACDVVKALNVLNPYLILAKVHRDDKTYVYADVASGTPRLIGLTETGLGTFLYLRTCSGCVTKYCRPYATHCPQ